MEHIVWAISFFVGMLLGKWIFSAHQRRMPLQKPVGALVVDSSDPDGPFLFLELYSGIEQVEASTTVLLNVEKKSYLPQD